MKRIRLRDRQLPDYTRGEEIFNMVSHIVGGAFGVVALVTCVVRAFLKGGAYEVVGAFIYGFSMIILYTMSSLYHGLKPLMAKKVFQIIDHCTIFILIAGTYTPIALSGLRKMNPALGWAVFGVVWGLSALGIVLNAIDLKKYSKVSMMLYILLGWCIVLTGKSAITALSAPGFGFMLAGGISYTFGAVLYAIAGKGKRPHRYMHSVFHLFVVLGSILQYFGILFYVIK
ncbi:MAG: hemolysin III family channel protein [Clostridiales bacterium]|nr:MAG: hemolysin III family channel protein [Clostridiales bacterium]